MPEQTKFVLDVLKIEVTNKCELYCIHCSNEGSPLDDREISFQKCVNIINEAADMGVREISISGGEPLLWPHLSKIIEVAYYKKIISTIFTSGYAPNAAELLADLKRVGLTKAIFSLYSSSKVQHEQITRRKGSFDKTLDVIMYANSIGLETELHFVVMSYNYNQIDKVVKLAKDCGTNTVSILRFAPQGRGSLLTNAVLNKVQNLELQKHIFELRNQGYNIRTGTPYNFLLVNENRQCESGMNKMTIDPDLRIYPCDGFKNILAEDFVGTNELSKLEKESLSNCWQYSPYLLCLRNYLTTDINQTCKDCSALKKCMSGCTAQKVLKHGKLLKCVDPDCLMI